jgi:hypothetical protein
LAGWPGKQSLRPSARRSHQHHPGTDLIPRIGSIPLAMLTVADLRVMFSTLRAALNAAIREGMITANPAPHRRRSETNARP